MEAYESSIEIPYFCKSPNYNEAPVSARKEMKTREKPTRSVHSGSFPPHLSDPSHSPVSERADRLGTGSRCRRTPSVSQRLKLGDLDSVSNARMMKVETRLRVQTPIVPNVSVRTRLKDVRNALTTSQELLKIINRVSDHEDRPSTRMSLISALHAELERARLQTNQLIQEQRSEKNDISYLMRCFAEEKEAWKSKEQEVVEDAIEFVAGELEVERKLRKRFETLNKKLGRELAETKSSLVKVVKELESVKGAREIVERVCDDLANDVGNNKFEVEQMQREPARLCDNVKKKIEMQRLVAMLREEQTHLDASDDANYNLDNKNVAVDKLRNQLDALLGIKRAEEKVFRSNDSNEVKFAAYLNKNGGCSNQSEEKEEGEVVDGVVCEEDLAQSELHSIELNLDNNKSYDWIHPSSIPLDSKRHSIDCEHKARKSTSKKGSRKSTSSFQRSISDVVKWRVNQAENHPILEDHVLDWERSSAFEKVASGKAYRDHFQEYNSSKNLRDQILSESRFGSLKVTASPTRQQWEQARPSRDLAETIPESASMVQQGNGLKSRLMAVRGDSLSSRKYK